MNINYYPNFAHERELDNHKEGVRELGIPYLVVQDNNGETWQAYGAHLWPILFLFDKKGNFRCTHIGE